MSYCPSYAWRSLFAGLKLIKRWLFWRISDGKRVRIWDDNWTPRHYAHKVLSPKVSSGSYQFVSNSIDHDLKSWNVNSLNSLFEPQEAKSIQSIRISKGCKEDKLVWLHMKNGIFQ
ncbi:hypothetical protein I3760_14G096100 [Carya illinoinensis]|nr:hypothetical protein I3760_14G096100 [Carya illinoinensis]